MFFLPQIRVFRANSALLAGEPNQENDEEEYLTVQIPPLSLVGAWLVRFLDARESRYAPELCVGLDRRGCPLHISRRLTFEALQTPMARATVSGSAGVSSADADHAIREERRRACGLSGGGPWAC